MTPEELMEERYILENLWPGCQWGVGTIFPANFERFEKYPYLVRKMGWWEDRKPHELPIYVKQKIGKRPVEFLRVLDPKYNMREFGHEPHTIEHRFVYPNAYDFLPATKEEFDEYVKSKS